MYECQCRSIRCVLMVQENELIFTAKIPGKMEKNPQNKQTKDKIPQNQCARMNRLLIHRRIKNNISAMLRSCRDSVAKARDRCCILLDSRAWWWNTHISASNACFHAIASPIRSGSVRDDCFQCASPHHPQPGPKREREVCEKN